MVLVLITIVLLGIFIWCVLRDRISHLRTRDIACSQVCDLNNPGAMTVCSTGKGSESREACNIYHSCVRDCRAKQKEQITERVHNLPINPEESWGSRYSHLLV